MSYISEFTKLPAKERRQLVFKLRYKDRHPDWDDTLVWLTKKVRQRVPSGSTVLDIGCGHGNYLLQELPTHFRRRVGIDAGPEQTSRNRNLDEIVYGRLESLPFPDASFDVVISLWVLEHLASPKNVFAEVRRVLRPGGLFVFATPNRSCWLIALRRLMPHKLAARLVKTLYDREEQDVFDVHYKANTLADVRVLASSCGFEIDLLAYNDDPSYTSFGPVSYSVSSWLSRRPWSWTKPHVLGILRKA